MGSGSTSRALVRLGIGVVQGAILAGLALADGHRLFPATVAQLYFPLVAVALFVPLLVSQSLGNLRRPTLILWALAATAIVAGLTWYAVWHDPAVPPSAVSPRILAILAVFLFVAHALVSCGDADRRIVARYPTLFDLAWKLGVQIVIIVCFLVAFWILLWLGMALFNMIGFYGFERFVLAPEVAIPLTTVAAAAALHATDLSAPLIRGVRLLALTLLSWLLPVIALIALAFLVSLAVSGLQPLWATRTAALVLIAAVGVMVIHINAAYQGGDANPPHILRVAGTLAAVLLVFLVWIAAYALWLRVTQYGWTVDRVTSAAGVAVAAMFALGYLVAALIPGPWLRFIERWNVYSTFFFLVVLFALATPIADPMRLSVQSQLQRLQSGAVKPDKFDFGYLKWYGGRFGREALAALSRSPNKAIAQRAATAARPVPLLLWRTHYSAAQIAAAITMHPAGAMLPASFVRQDWSKLDYPALGDIESCMTVRSDVYRCDAAEIDIDKDGSPELVLIGSVSPKDYPASWSAWIYRFEKDRWQTVAELPSQPCLDDRGALLAGKFTLAAPAFRNLLIAGRIYRIEPVAAEPADCSSKIGSLTEPRSVD